MWWEFRNVLVHRYATLDNKIVWGVVENNVLPLKKTLAKLIADT